MTNEYVSKRAALACIKTIREMMESLCSEVRDIGRLLEMASTIEVEVSNENEADKSDSEEEAD